DFAGLSHATRNVATAVTSPPMMPATSAGTSTCPSPNSHTISGAKPTPPTTPVAPVATVLPESVLSFFSMIISCQNLIESRMLIATITIPKSPRIAPSPRSAPTTAATTFMSRHRIRKRGIPRGLASQPIHIESLVALERTDQCFEFGTVLAVVAVLGQVVPALASIPAALDKHVDEPLVVGAVVDSVGLPATDARVRSVGAVEWADVAARFVGEAVGAARCELLLGRGCRLARLGSVSIERVRADQTVCGDSHALLVFLRGCHGVRAEVPVSAVREFVALVEKKLLPLLDSAPLVVESQRLILARCRIGLAASSARRPASRGDSALGAADLA